MNNLPIYNTNDLTVRTAIASCGVVGLAVDLAKHARAGSVNIAEQKALEMAVAQLEIVRGYNILATYARGVFKPLTNTGSPLSTTLTINGLTASGSFLITSDNTATSERIVNAINGTVTVPNYSAELVGPEVHITAEDIGSTPNGYDISYTGVPGSITSTFIHFYGGQDGALPDDNHIDEETLEALFNNISNITGVMYAPLGTKYTAS